jgi:signal transduction histidine kinase
VITRVDQIRHLTPEEASQGIPVRIRGVVTMDAPAPDFFIQDSTAGIYVEGNALVKYPHLLGQLVELDGITGPGKFAPVIRERALRVIGSGTLPKAQLFPFSALADGQQDSQWVEVRGIVRWASIDSTSWKEPTLAMRIASGGGEFNLRVPISHGQQDVSSWIDSEVLVEGVCGSLYNTNRQLTGILFYVPRISFIKVEAPALEVPVSSLLRFSPGGGSRRRVRVRAVVVYQQQGHALFLQSEGKGLRVLTQQDTPLETGDQVDVIGFPAMGESAPILEAAVFHRLSHDKEPLPIPLNLDAPWEQYDGALITTDAKLLNRQVRPDETRLLLQHADVIFDANLPSGAPNPLAFVPLNSEVQVTGICLVRSGGLWRIPQSFQVLLRSPKDVIVVRSPSWWTLRHTLWILGVTASVLLIVLAWIVVLGRRLREQMEIIRQKLRSGAVLEERNRIARELHDTLEQELAGITMQLDLAVDCLQQAPRVAQQALETARNMSRHSMIEARRSVWDLRCQLLEDGDLVSALSQIVRPLVPDEQVAINVRIDGKPFRLPGPIEMNLLRIGQEAVSNAVKHGKAEQISMQLSYAPGMVRLTVKDDGKGFAVEQGSPTGHFGLLDMRERAQSMGSLLVIESQPGHGACISVEVQVRPKQAIDEEFKANTYSGR